MNKNKIISTLLVLAIYFGPVGMLFFYDDVLVDTFAEMSLFLIATFGMIAAFYINVNQPFGRNQKAQLSAVKKADARQAA